MSDEPEATTTTEQPNPAAVVEQATPKDGIQDVEAAPETTEQPTETEQPATEEETEQKRQSRSERYRRKISALSGVIERTETRVQQLERENEELKKAKASDAAPNPADFPNGEWDSGYIAKLAAHEALKAVRPELEAVKTNGEKERQTNAAKTAAQRLEESAAQVRKVATDFDATLQAFIDDGGEFAPNLRDAISASGDKAAIIMYNLAKDSDLVDRLNAMSREEVLLEVGELRAKAALPQPKTQTKAPAPLRTVTGGASPTADLMSLAKSDDVTEYWKTRKEQMKARA